MSSSFCTVAACTGASTHWPFCLIWRDAATRINWRRFFEISDLVALRMDRAPVFEAVHRFVFQVYADGLIDGVRVDHIDGIADPRVYCERLRDGFARTGRSDAPFIVVEKILARGERLREDWHVDGTTGYEFMDLASALLHDAPEYVVGDMISPFKAVIGDSYKAVEKRLLGAIHLRFGLPARLPEDLTALIKTADRNAAWLEATKLAGFEEEEARKFFGPPPKYSAALIRDYLTPWPADTAESRLMERVEGLLRAAAPARHAS